MSITDLQMLFKFIGGLGMFLYGMNAMADGLQKSAGHRMQQLLGALTKNRLMGVILGAGITAIIQSSSATTVMVVGFVNAGIMNLGQAVGIIMGANIGTTVTSWIVSMSEWGEMLKPEFFAPALVGVGAVMTLFCKNSKKKQVGEILVGFGVLFIGLTFMSASITPYRDAPIFAQAFTVLGRNPFLGILAGAAVTGIIQSSSASVGILQTLAMNGVVTTGAAIYITLGQNIGTCLTAMLSSAGANRTAKRAAAIHLTFNTLGAVIFGVAMYALSLLRPAMAGSEINSVQISMFHTIFNVTNTLLLYPFAGQLVKISGLLVKDGEAEKEAGEERGEIETAFRHLDQRIFESPVFAIEVAQMETVHMGQIALNNIRLATNAILSRDKEKAKEVYGNEKDIDKMEELLTGYLIKVNNLSLTEHQKLQVNNLFYSISDIERVGDHCENLAEQADYMAEHNVSFSDTGNEDLSAISEKVVKSFTHAIAARQTGDMDDVRKVSQYEDDVDMLEEELRDKHIERLSSGQCDPSSGVVFLDIISNLERISDHAYNLAGYVKDEI